MDRIVTVRRSLDQPSASAIANGVPTGFRLVALVSLSAVGLGPWIVQHYTSPHIYDPRNGPRQTLTCLSRARHTRGSRTSRSPRSRSYGCCGTVGCIAATAFTRGQAISGRRLCIAILARFVSICSWFQLLGPSGACLWLLQPFHRSCGHKQGRSNGIVVNFHSRFVRHQVMRHSIAVQTRVYLGSFPWLRPLSGPAAFLDRSSHFSGRSIQR